MQNWHNMTGDEVSRYWQSRPQLGLSPAIVKQRQIQFGYNNLQQRKKISAQAILISQFNDFMVIVLLAAAILSGFLGQWDDAVTIMTIVIINALLGFIQEYKVEHSLVALKQLSAPRAKCRRQGKPIDIPAAELVPGDIIEIEPGDRIPADARLVTVFNLECDEAALTGESVPRSKYTETIAREDTQLGDRRNMVYAGTTVTRGKGLAIVVATGMKTQIGQIAGMLGEVG
ncbi:MAG: ATPase, partial [Firmicutes bacterium]|nr:ATPase [Bacillota bacterium]